MMILAMLNRAAPAHRVGSRTHTRGLPARGPRLLPRLSPLRPNCPHNNTNRPLTHLPAASRTAHKGSKTPPHSPPPQQQHQKQPQQEQAPQQGPASSHNQALPPSPASSPASSAPYLTIEDHSKALHQANSRINDLRTQPHPFESHQQPSTTGGPIMVAFDNTEDAQDALRWVAQNLVGQGNELRLVHVVCDPRAIRTSVSVGTTPSGRAISLDSLDSSEVQGAEVESYNTRLMERAEHVAREGAARALGAKAANFKLELPRLPGGSRSAAGIAEAVLAAARQADAKMLVVASHGPGALAEYGSVARYCYQHCELPLLLVPSAVAVASHHLHRHHRHHHSEMANAPVTDDEMQQQDQQEEAAAEGQAVAPAGKKAAAQQRQEVILVVNHLEELAGVWQWVADNVTRKGDLLHIWHVAGPSASGMPSLPTALATQLRARGLADVRYHSLYSSTGDPMDVGEQVCNMAAASERVKMVVMLNYSQRGLLQEALHGSVSSHLSRHCVKPLLLLQLAE